MWAATPSGSLAMAIASASSFCCASSGVRNASITMRPGARCTPGGKGIELLVDNGRRGFDQHAGLPRFGVQLIENSA